MVGCGVKTGTYSPASFGELEGPITIPKSGDADLQYVQNRGDNCIVTCIFALEMAKDSVKVHLESQ